MSKPEEYYNIHSKGYAQKWDLSPEGLKQPKNYYRIKIIELLLNSASIKHGEKVIELGCGTGLVLKETLKITLPIYGADISLEMLQRVKDSVLNDKKVSIVSDLSIYSAEDLKSDVLLTRDDLLKSQLPINFFDKVLSMEVLRYVEDLPRCLNNVRAIMKDDGIFVFTITNLFSFDLFPVKFSLRKLFDCVDKNKEIDQYFVTERSIKKNLAKAHFSIISFKKIGLLSSSFLGRRLARTVNGAKRIISLDEKLLRIPIINKLFGTFIIAVKAVPIPDK